MDLIRIGGGLGLLLYMPLIGGILFKNKKQNCVTWVLWVLLDAITLANVIITKGNATLLECYVIGGTGVSLLLFYKKQFKWMNIETMFTCLVIICLVVWYMLGSRVTIVASSLAVFIAGMPQVIDSWRSPDRETGYIYLGYALSNYLAFMGGKSWAIEEWFYYGVCVVLCLMIGIAALRKAEKKYAN